jgi:hypothetical protein
MLEFCTCQYDLEAKIFRLIGGDVQGGISTNEIGNIEKVN